MGRMPAERTVFAACPHDCPDTCAMHVHRGRRPGAPSRSPATPTTRSRPGFLCGKVSNYLDRVYAEDRLLHPLDPRRGQGRGQLPPRDLGRGARPRRRAACARPIDAHGAETVLPYSYLGTQGMLQGDVDERALLQRARRERARADHLRDGGHARHARRPTASRPRSTPSGGRSPATSLVWGWNPMSTAPHLWKLLLEARRNGGEARGRRPLPQPHGPGGRRARAPAARHRRRARAGDDARDRRRRPRTTRSGAARTPTGYDELRRAPGRATRSSTARRSATCRPRRSCAWPRSSRQAQPALLRLGVGAQRHLGAPIAYRTIACLPALTGAWRHDGRRLLLRPDGDRRGGRLQPARARRPAARAPFGRSTWRSSATRLTRPDSRSAGDGDGRLELQPGRDRARPGARAGRAAPRGPLHCACSSSS